MAKGQRNYAEITPVVEQLAALCVADSWIEPQMYTEYKVFRGLRDLDGNGVLTGLTEVSEIQAKKTVDGVDYPCEGKLFYRGYEINDLVGGFLKDNRFGFEETTYLLLFGELPTPEQLDDFKVWLLDNPIDERRHGRTTGERAHQFWSIHIQTFENDRKRQGERKGFSCHKTLATAFRNS